MSSMILSFLFNLYIPRIPSFSLHTCTCLYTFSIYICFTAHFWFIKEQGLLCRFLTKKGTKPPRTVHSGILAFTSYQTLQIVCNENLQYVHTYNRLLRKFQILLFFSRFQGILVGGERGVGVVFFHVAHVDRKLFVILFHAVNAFGVYVFDIYLKCCLTKRHFSTYFHVLLIQILVWYLHEVL